MWKRETGNGQGVPTDEKGVPSNCDIQTQKLFTMSIAMLSIGRKGGHGKWFVSTSNDVTFEVVLYPLYKLPVR